MYASSPAGLVFWAYSDSGGVQHFGSLVDGTVIGPFPHDSPDAAAYDTLAGEAFEAEATAVTFAAYPAAVSCEQEYQLGTSPGM